MMTLSYQKCEILFFKYNDVKVIKALTFKQVTFISCQSFMIEYFNLENLKSKYLHI